MKHILAISVATIIISLVAISLSVIANQKLVQGCVSPNDVAESTGHFLTYGGALGTNMLVPRSINDFYRARLACLKAGEAFGSDAIVESQIKLMEQMRFVESFFEQRGAYCVKLLKGGNVCVK